MSYRSRATPRVARHYPVSGYSSAASPRVATHYPVGLGGFFDSLVSGIKSGINFYGTAKQNQGVVDITNKQLAAGVATTGPAAEGGMPWGTIAVVGGLGVAAVLLLRKKK